MTVTLERIIEEDTEGEAPYLGYELRLNPASNRIRQKDTAWLPLISYRKDEARAWISLEGVDQDKSRLEGKLFRPHKSRELHLVVRADGGTSLPARFQCWVDDNGCLIMKRLNPDTPTVPNPGAS